MRAAILVGPSRFEVRDVQAPAPVSEWTTIDVESCGVCGSDLAIYDRDPPIPRFWPGHEIAGQLHGERVVVNPLVCCGGCEHCRTGREHLCADARMISHHLPGGFASRVHVPEAQVRRIDAPAEHASLVEPLASSLHAISVAGPLEGRKVAILGGGTIGLLLVQLARARSAARVGMEARHDFQTRLAHDLGAGPADFTPDVVLVAAAGDGSALQWAADHLRPEGRAVLLGNVYASRSLNLKWVVERELEIRGSQRYRPRDFEGAARLIESGAVEVESLVTHRFPLERIAEAYAVARDKARHRSVKVVVTPNA